jgi:hypothetical protein
VDEPDDHRLTARALDIMASSRVTDLRSGCDDVASLIAARERPIPELPDDAARRASRLLVLLLQSRDRERRWQALCFPDI